MKRLLFIICLCSCIGRTAGQGVSQLRNFYEHADREKYTRAIMEDMAAYNKWVRDTLPTLKYGDDLKSMFHVCDINLHEERKLYVLSVAFYDIENYDGNIYNHIVIDSLRGLQIACVDKRMKLKGITDVNDVGEYDNYLEKEPTPNLLQQILHHKHNKCKHGKKMAQKLFKSLLSQGYDILLYNSMRRQWMGIKDDKIYMFLLGTSMELQSYVDTYYGEDQQKLMQYMDMFHIEKQRAYNHDSQTYRVGKLSPGMKRERIFVAAD